MSNPFYRLAPFIQEFIYRENWSQLREVQVLAINAVLDTDQHILITSRTASGKTEAAFLPVLTSLHENPSSTIGAMYIGPLKALINDQFYRLEKLLQESHIPVQSWHGDVVQSKKQAFLRQAQGILQITPESLEAMLINRQTDLGRLFGDLRFVIIDELHAFIGSDRGRQVLCLLQRLARYQTKPARRIGLSATLGQPELAMEWLSGGDNVPVIHIQDTVGRREVQLGLEHFISPKKNNDDEDLLEQVIPQFPQSTIEQDEIAPVIDETEHLFLHMSQMVSQARKTLIFANSRNDTEEIIQNLRRLAGKENSDEDGYYVHHGSISGALREQAEEDMRNPDKLACIAATITLELGIDLGNLDQVLQLNSTSTVSSFVQRLGRSGRRGNPAKMFFYSHETSVSPNEITLGNEVPWSLIQTIAIIQLYLEERWIEPPDIPNLPLSLLYHQTMSLITSHSELRPPDLAERILTLSPFKQVSSDQYRTLLRHLTDTEHLERIEGGGLIVGAQGEKIVNNYRFYATFHDEIAYAVREGQREIGSIQSIPQVDERFRLAGRSWRVIEIDENKRVIYVERVKGKAKAAWLGGGITLHNKILQRMRRVLEEDVDYGYLQDRAITRLQIARDRARTNGLIDGGFINVGGNRFMLLPWQGSKIMRTIGAMLTYAKISSIDHMYYFDINTIDASTLKTKIIELQNNLPNANTLSQIPSLFQLQANKYDRFIPEQLLREAYEKDQLDVVSAEEILNDLSLKW